MRVDVVHAGGVPTGTTGFENRDRKFDFSVTVRRQFGDLKRSHARSVVRCTFLREAKEPVVKVEDAASGPGAAFIVLDQRALWVFGPWASQFIGEIESQRVVLVRCGTGKQPPAIVEAHERRIGKLAF